MGLLMQRLTDLWERPTTPPTAPCPVQNQIPSRMGVTFREPMNISGTVLMPGRYVFRLLDPGTARNPVEVFNEDQTKLIARITPMSGY
jgi:hypothetical protein